MNEEQNIFNELKKLTMGNEVLFLRVLKSHLDNLAQLRNAIHDHIPEKIDDYDYMKHLAHKTKATLITLQQPQLVFKIYRWLEKFEKTPERNEPDFLSELEQLIQVIEKKLCE